jgi:hypothetical protein
MSPAEHLELAAFLSAHGELLVRTRRPVAAARLNRYWTASRVRWDGWMSRLKERAFNSRRKQQPGRVWQERRAAIVNVLVSEVPMRVWTAVTAACDRSCGAQEGEPVVRSTLTAHQEARCLALQCVVHSRGVPADDAISLNRLRHQTERWTDLLIGYLLQRHKVAEFAALPERACEFSADFTDRASWQPGEAAWKLLTASLRNRFHCPAYRATAGEEELDAAVASAILDCLPEPLAAAFEPSPSLWLHQVRHAADETHRMLDELCRLEFQAS